jgi:tRNA (guanine6-N2)-methyltransferase
MKRTVRKSKPSLQKTPPSPPQLYEAEVMTGLKPYAIEEMRRLLGSQAYIHRGEKPEEILFDYAGHPSLLFQLRQTAAVYRVEHFAIPRPLALLGHQNFQRLLSQIQAVQALHPAIQFQTFRLSAAGKNSSVFNRIKDEIAAQTGLAYDEEGGQLFLRVRPSSLQGEGWEVLFRLTPRPLSARDWRICDMVGALNATIASAMVEISQPTLEDRVLNLLCGSGTLLIERRARMAAAALAGCDHNPETLRCARQNIAASGFSEDIDLLEMDATRLQLPDACIDVLYADLPWGQLVGSHEDNKYLYPKVLKEAARVATPEARFVLISHEIRLLESILGEGNDLWRVENMVKVFQGGLHPRIYLLSRNA